LWRPAIVALVLMGLSFTRALSWRWINEHGGGVILTPRGENLLAAAAVAIPLFPAGALLWSAITRRLRTRLAVTLVLLIVLGAAAGFLTLVAGMPLFGSHYESSAISPDGTREAHLRVDGLFGCKGSIYVSERRALWGQFTVTRDVDCDTMGVGWTEDGGVEVTGGPPKPLNLDWGPH
jgi:hypothetical protein